MTSNEQNGEKEVDRWSGSSEWEMAEVLHGRLCRQDHQMDGCWGLNSPYDLKQPTLSEIQRRYLGLACALMEAFDTDQINIILNVMAEGWTPDPFPSGPAHFAMEEPTDG